MEKSYNTKNKSFRAIILLLLLSTFLSLPSIGQFVRTQGTHLIDEQGNRLDLAGMNLGNWLLWEGYLMMGDFNFKTHSQFFDGMKSAFNGNHEQTLEFEHQWRMNYVTNQAILDLKNLGFNSVRVPFHHNLFWDGTQLTDRGFQYFDRVIEYCRNNGMYILLDMHAAPGYQNPGDHSDNPHGRGTGERESVKFWDDNNVEIAAQIWRHIASRYRNEPVIWGYDLINEPVPQDGREYELLPSYITMRNAIREVDNNHIIVVEGSWWGSDMSKIDWLDPTTQSRTGITSQWDDKLVYQTHHYVFGDANAITDLNSRKAITDKLNVPFILGEYGEDTENILRQITDWCLTNNVGYFPWSFKKMYHDKTLWTINPNTAYNKVRDYIKRGGRRPPNAYEDMISFCNNNIANGKPDITFHNGFYAAVNPNILPPPPTRFPIPGVIQAESYSDQFGTQTESTSDTGGGQNIGWIDPGDWVEYLVNIQAAGSYTLRYRVASTGTTGQIQAKIGSTLLATTNVPNTGGWQTWTTITTTVDLPSGDQTLRLDFTGGGFNLNWLEFIQSSPSGSIPNGIYRINSVLSNKSLDVTDQSLVNGALLQQWDWSNGNNQKFKIEALGEGLYSMTAVHSNKVLEVSGSSIANGAQIQQWDWANRENQKWRIEDISNGVFKITASHSNKVMHVGSRANGSKVVQQDWKNSNNQKWKLELLLQASLKEDPINGLREIEIYPNPVEKTLYIANINELNRIEIFSLTGSLKRNFTRDDFQKGEIDVQNLENGLYFIRFIENGGNIKTHKFIKR